MREHLSILEVKQLAVSALPEDELVAAALHTAKCQSCNQQFVEELKRQRGSASFNFTLEPEFWFRNDHVDFDQLVALADKTLDEETEEILNLHLQTCEECRADVRSFLAFRVTTAKEMDISYRPTHYSLSGDVSDAPWWQRLQLRPVYAVAAIVLVAVAVLLGVIALNKRPGALEATKQGQADPGNKPSPIASFSPAPDVVPNPPGAGDSVKVAILKDRAGDVTIDKNGRVTGLDDVEEDSRRYVARVALAGQFEVPDVLRDLSGEQSGLRGDDDGPQEFRLLYPLRSVIVEDRPVFQWKSLPGVSSYRVYVLDANGKQVNQSEELPPNQTQWKTPAPLRRGQVFSWAVIAILDGKKVVSPSASDPEMKFAVLSTADFQAWSRLKKSKSHLALGVFYARTGLLNQAEREFESLIKLNPQSELPKKLLQSLRSIRTRIK